MSTESPKVAEDVPNPTDSAVIEMMLALGRLDAYRLETEIRSDLPELARMLVACHELLLNLSAVADAVEANVAAMMRSKDCVRVSVDGIGELKRSPRYNDSYDSHQLFRLLVEKAVADPETGKVDHELKNRVMHVLSSAMPISASTRWKQGGLKALDVDMDEYKSRVYGRDRIEIT